MKVVIAGGTGFLGSALTESFKTDGHEVAVLTRQPRGPGHVAWDQAASAIDGADAVINLAGVPIDAGRWTRARKATIRESRISATRSIVKAIGDAKRRPRVLLNASAIGIYADRGGDVQTEESPSGSDFLATVCVAWEAAAMEAASATRVVLMRTGLVLDGQGGALPKMALPFKLFAGGRAGSGDQYYSWIHRDDWVRLARWGIDQAEIKGALNITAPSPATNREFTAALARRLHRPALAPAPAFALRLVLGEMADALILTGRRVIPAKAERGGFVFRYPDLDSALRDIYRGP